MANDWNIRPHAHADLNHVFLIVKGAGVMRAKAETIAFAAPCLVLAPSGLVHGFVYEAVSAGSVLTIADSYLRELIGREPGFGTLFRAACQLPLPEDSCFREMIALLVQARATDPVVQGPQARLVARYRGLIEAHFREGLDVEAYTARLGCSDSRLRTACLRATGAGPLQLMHDRMLLEAKRALIYSNMTVAEVGCQLGFHDPAYFSRFFTKAADVSPRVFRAGAPAAQTSI